MRGRCGMRGRRPRDGAGRIDCSFCMAHAFHRLLDATRRFAQVALPVGEPMPLLASASDTACEEKALAMVAT